MTYYDDLTNDKKRVNAFFKAIRRNVHGICYDLGTGSGVLAGQASKYASHVYAMELNPRIISKTRENLEHYDNVSVIHDDASKYEFKGKIDVIICEMLDTALIDEEQVPVINNVVKYTDEDTIFIPESVYSTIELINTQVMGTCYYEDSYPKYSLLSDAVRYGQIMLNRHNNPEFKEDIKIIVKSDGLLNAIKITTYTILTKDMILEPTPMLNPPLIIPIEELDVYAGDEILINLTYTMGGGLNTIQTTRKRN